MSIALSVSSSEGPCRYWQCNRSAYPSPIPGPFAASYLQGVVLSRGTGKLAKAIGKIFSWGAVNLANNELTLRFESTVCFAQGN